PRYALHPYCALLHLPSFPTRRSSDLVADEGHQGALGQLGAQGLLVAVEGDVRAQRLGVEARVPQCGLGDAWQILGEQARGLPAPDRKSTRLNSSHVSISYAVFCLKKK